MTTKSYVEFYREHQVSPVNYRLGSLEKHFCIRKALYRYLGILPAYVKGRRVLEAGPGSGYNALYTASLEPAVYDMVEPNPTGVATIKQVFAQYGGLLEAVRIHAQLIQDFPLKDPYDFVFCEGMIAGQDDPAALFRHMARYVAPGGVISTTTVDPVSCLADSLRRLLAQLLLDPQIPIMDNVARLLPVFAPHLDSLSSMTRRYEDWVVDNLLNPAAINPHFSMADVIGTLGGSFQLLGSSPVFFTDWSWYKSLQGGAAQLNQKALSQYWQNVHNLLDYRTTWAPRNEQENRTLYAACVGFRHAVRDLENNGDGLSRIEGHLKELIAQTATFAPQLAEALTGYLAYLDKPDPFAIAGDEKLGPWFGRGQQNITLNETSL